MRRVLRTVLGILELAVAIGLFYGITLLPDEQAVREPLGNVAAITLKAEDGVSHLRDRLAALRERQPELHSLAERLRDNTRTLADAVSTHSVDLDAIELIRDALGDVARGLDALKDQLRPETGKQVRAGLVATADFLDNRVARDLDLFVPGIKADAQRLAKVLRESEGGVAASIENWPRVQANLNKAAEVLRQTQQQLDRALDNAEEYESALKRSTALARTFADALPLYTEQLEADLTRQETSLEELRGGLEQVRGAIPGFTDGTVKLLTLGRWLLLLVGGIVFVHGLMSFFGRGDAA
jgi:chromosome segregation ATPase